MPKQNTILKISKDEMKQMSFLLDSGLDTSTIINLSFKNHDRILDQLKNGKKLQEILCHEHRGRYFQLIELLTQYMSFKQAIDCANKIDKSSNELFKKTGSKIIYPLFIFCFAYFMILFFSNSILPQMNIFSSSESSFLILDILKIIFTILFVFITICLGLSILTFIHKKIKLRLMKFLNHIEIYRLYQSIRFSIVFEKLFVCGLSTKQCIELLTKFTFYTGLQELGKSMYANLNKGKSFELIIDELPFEKSLKDFFTIGIRTGSLDQVLSLYQKQGFHRFEKKMNQTVLAFQVFSYCCVGILVLVVYQVMLVPLNMLSTM